VLRGLKPLLAIAGIALAGCSAPAEPQVTFFSHGQSVEVDAARYCDPTGADCAPPTTNPVGRLPVPPGSPLQISVPQQVAAAPWQVAFVYRGVNGEEVGGKTPVFAPNKQYAYTLRLPPDGARFEHIEVQRFSAVLSAGDEGGVDFGIGGSWILKVD
jgi:hypothetical protein